MSSSTLNASVLEAKLAHCDQVIRQGLMTGTIGAEMKKIKDDLVSEYKSG